jgi:hypothetical protein
MWTCDLLLLQFQALEQLLADGLLLQLHTLLLQTRIPNLGVQDAGLGVIELEEGRHEGAGELFLHPQHRLPEVVLTFLLQVLLRVVLLLLGFSTNHNPNYGREVLGGGEAFERLKRGGRRRVLEPHPRNNPQVADEIRAEKTHTTHVNTMKLISFWCSKLGCIF